MNVIDALVVTLGLNDAEFQAKLEKLNKAQALIPDEDVSVGGRVVEHCGYRYGGGQAL